MVRVFIDEVGNIIKIIVTFKNVIYDKRFFFEILLISDSIIVYKI
jgi:hypothetical protein